MRDYINLVGSKLHSEIPLWGNACDVFFIPSLNEGNSTVMFEGLGCGKPFIGTRVGVIPEITTSEDYGFLCDPSRPVDLADNILLAFNKGWDKDKIKEYAGQFTWDVIAKNILNVYTKFGSFNFNFIN